LADAIGALASLLPPIAVGPLDQDLGRTVPRHRPGDAVAVPADLELERTAMRGWPWLTISRMGVSLPFPRSTSPYSAYVLASRTLDFPEPVGPTMANGLSRPSKSTTCSSRNEVNP